MEKINLIDDTSKNSVNNKGESKSGVPYGKSFVQIKSHSSRHISPISKVVAKVKAYLIVKGVKSALKEVDLIESGKKKPKSLDQLLNEL